MTSPTSPLHQTMTTTHRHPQMTTTMDHQSLAAQERALEGRDADPVPVSDAKEAAAALVAQTTMTCHLQLMTTKLLGPHQHRLAQRVLLLQHTSTLRLPQD